MKSRNLLLLGMLALVSVFTWQSCDLVDVEGPEMDLSEYTTSYTVKGLVSSADDGQGISGVTLNIGGNEVVTDSEGNYVYEAEKMPSNGTSVVVSHEGFINAYSSIEYGNITPTALFLDFSLTRALPAGFISLSEGGTLTFDDVTVTIPANTTGTINGAAVNSVQLSISPLSPISTMGSWNSSSLKTLVIKPAGLALNSAMQISIEVPEWFNNTNLELYQFDNANNNWEATSVVVTFNSQNGTVDFPITKAGTFKVNNPDDINIVTDQLLTEAPSRFEPNSCDCEAAFVYNGGYWIRKVVSMDPQADLSELNSLHFFSDYNVSYSASLLNGILVMPAVTNVAVGECELKTIDITRHYRQITGTYEFQGETKSFDIIYYFAITHAVGTNDCPVTSNCHQGCPTVN